VTAHATAPIYLDVILSDGTGTINLLFQGRTSIPGVCERSHLRVAGTPWLMSEMLLMLDPLYEFRD